MVPNDKSKSVSEQIMDLLEDANNPEVSDKEYEERRAELEREKHAENVVHGYVTDEE